MAAGCRSTQHGCRMLIGTTWLPDVDRHNMAAGCRPTQHGCRMSIDTTWLPDVDRHNMAAGCRSAQHGCRMSIDTTWLPDVGDKHQWRLAVVNTPFVCGFLAMCLPCLLCQPRLKLYATNAELGDAYLLPRYLFDAGEACFIDAVIVMALADVATSRNKFVFR